MSVNSAGERGVDDTVNMPIFVEDRIFISGLPVNMPEQHLFDTLWDEFSTVGPIKVSERIIL
jgi:hypothetical protein